MSDTEYIIEEFEEGKIISVNVSGIIFETPSRKFHIVVNREYAIVNHGWLDNTIASSSKLCSAQHKALLNRLNNHK